MRLTQAAALALSPMLLVASAVARPAKTDLTAAVPGRVSTGITAPSMVYPANFHIPANALSRTEDSDAQVVLSLNVDEHGNAHVLKVIQSANPELDNRVVTAVQQSHFHPATLNDRSIAMDMDLKVVVKHDAILTGR